MTNNNRLISPLMFYILFYIYFTLGPVLAYYLGFGIYSGIKETYIADAVTVFCIALLGLFVSKIVQSRPSKILVGESSRSKWHVQLVLIALSLVLGLAYLNLMMKIGGASKKSDILDKIGALHYIVMYIAPLLVCIRLSIKRSFTKYDAVIFMAFTWYCLLIGERDFVLIIIPCILTYSLYRKISLTKLGLLLLVCSILFTALSLLRANLEGDSVLEALKAILSQGSNLMIVTNVLRWIEVGYFDFYYGVTYVDSVLSLVQLKQFETIGRLTIWFTEMYGANVRPGAFGFSIEAEAFMNFGYIGVFAFFFCVGSLFRVFWLRAIAGDSLALFISVYASYIAIYAIRGDFNMMLKGIVYGVLAWFFFYSITYGRFIIRKISWER
ncbi:O-antigen polymerase [Psychrosphaera aestuarii]|uniref:O-antigen polymerase n=1 Tax=Psychrosphaera aestuarii TaxID=1266052 RepID=UPI001B3198ED|nr:O-antigen polymerase [Psychrosphaera aestuarii]